MSIELQSYILLKDENTDGLVEDLKRLQLCHQLDLMMEGLPLGSLAICVVAGALLMSFENIDGPQCVR